jgi:hypothetical protein
MNRRRGCIEWFVVAAVILAALTLAGLGAYAFLQIRLQQARTRFEPPNVFISEPPRGASVPADTELEVCATASGRVPIVRMELWVDGELLETQGSESGAGGSPLYAYFVIAPSAGPHVLHVRAVNAEGIIGDSLPLAVTGEPLSDQTLVQVGVGPDQTVADIAESFDTDVDTLHQLNPELGGQEPSEGAVVVVPAPPSGAAAGPTGSPVGPTFPSGPPALPETGPVLPPQGPPLKVVEPSPLPVDVGGLVGAVVNPWAPAAPTGLQSKVTDCTVRLAWKDNANNEDHFEVWMWGPGYPGRLVAKLQAAPGGSAWYEFPAPSWGHFVFWVEAVNSLGRQPSNYVAVTVAEPSCAQTLATHLKIQPLDLTVPANYQNVYCYLSFEGTPHGRLPAGKNDFIQVQGGKGDIGSWAAGNPNLVVPVPADGSLEMEGECWGRASKPVLLGSFTSEYSSNTWDGKRRSVQGASFEMGLAIEPLGAVNTSDSASTYNYEDPTMPVPYNLRIKEWGFSDPTVTEYALQWDWSGDEKKIKNFQVLLNGAPYGKPVEPQYRMQDVTYLPFSCGQHVHWQVQAVANETYSVPSQELVQYDVIPCPLIAEVKFDWIGIGEVDNAGWILVPGYNLGRCDTIGANFVVRVNNDIRIAGPWYADMWVGPKNVQMSCGSYTFYDLLKVFPNYQDDPAPDTFQVLLRGDNPSLSFMTRFMYFNSWGEPTSFAWNSKTISMPYEQWKNYSEKFSFGTSGGDVRAYVEVSVRAYVRE